MHNPTHVLDRRMLQPEDMITRHIYAEQRGHWLATMREYLAKRRVEISEDMTLLFENAITVRHQIMEVIYWETWNDEAANRRITEELELYSPLLPVAQSLSATLMIGRGSYEEGLRFGKALLNGQARIALLADGQIIPAMVNDPNPDPADPVKFLTFSLNNAAVAQLIKATECRLLLQMNNTTTIQVLASETLSSLINDVVQSTIDQKQFIHSELHG